MDDLEAIRQAADDIDEAQRRRDEAIITAVRSHGRSQADAAQAARITRQRVSQILQGGGPLPGRPVLAPDPGDVTICVVEKRESERGQPTVVRSTMTAVTKLKDLAKEFGTAADYEAVPPPGLLDLNRPNLVVLMGPRTSALIAAMVTADPDVKWQQDKRRGWFITDMRTGVEYHSDFDEGWEPRREGERRCIAHIGRIRRPDGEGSFLYLAGAHAPGTAGAVDYFCREIGTIWDRVKRSLWSGVVCTTVGEDGEIISADLATPEIYVHGRR